MKYLATKVKFFFFFPLNFGNRLNRYDKIYLKIINTGRIVVQVEQRFGLWFSKYFNKQNLIFHFWTTF